MGARLQGPCCLPSTLGPLSVPLPLLLTLDKQVTQGTKYWVLLLVFRSFAFPVFSEVRGLDLSPGAKDRVPGSLASPEQLSSALHSPAAPCLPSGPHHAG